MIKTTLSFAALLTLTSSLQAANQYTLESISVTVAQDVELNKEDVPDSVTVITKEAIEEAHVTTLAEALNRLGNIAMTQNGGPGTLSSMYVRGMDTRRTLVLIDGVRYNNPTGIGASAEFSQIMLYDVEQIEIVKGAQSGVWGADASAGVINIVTARAKKGLHATANMEYGSFDTKVGSLQASYATDDFDILMGAMEYNRDGFSAVEPNRSSPDYGKRYDDLGLEKDVYVNKSFNARLGWNIGRNDRVEASIQTFNSLTQYDASTYDFVTGVSTPTDDPTPEQTLQNRFYSASYKHSSTNSDMTLQYNYSTFDRNIKDSYGQYHYKGAVNEVKLDSRQTYLKDSFVRFGTSYQVFKQKEVVAGEDKNYNNSALFLTNYNSVGLLASLETIITESIRYDSYSAFNNAFTGKIGVKQYLYNSYYVSANLGTGYNIPTLGQLYGPWSPNPDLEPEEVITGDITLGNDTLWITGFYNSIDNLIEYGYPMYTNVTGRSTLKGAEVGYRDYFADRVGITANYTYLNAKDADGKDLARRPKHQLDASVVYYATENFDLGLNGQYIGERYDAADKQGAQTGRYVLVNLVSNVKVNDYLSVYGKVDNITDRYYQTVDGYATAGRSLYLGLNAQY
ncbi:MAG: TonB-dependent receptor [Helicobacteraceae bacterium]|jgi:vitamin B12 transporter|nr:TonB-dependent receptor [Helicobacteraceae bacterium]